MSCFFVYWMLSLASVWSINMRGDSAMSCLFFILIINLIWKLCCNITTFTTMNDYVTIKVYPSTRESLKLLSAMNNSTAMEYLDDLIEQKMWEAQKKIKKVVDKKQQSNKK